MNRGIIIFAHNNENIDYVKLSIVSAKLASKNLKLPVSLISDEKSISRYDINELKKSFDNIIISDIPKSTNKRILDNSIVSFLNFNRFTSWDLTPYDHTLIIDADYFIFTDKLNQYWDMDQSLMISAGVDYFSDSFLGRGDVMVSDISIPLRWATTVMFKRNQESKLFFNLVEFVKENYIFYSNLYSFDSRMYRNDVAFSIAEHIMNGHMNINIYRLPCVKTLRSTAKILKLKKDSYLKFLLTEPENLILEIRNTDIHFLNKSDLMKNMEEFL